MRASVFEEFGGPEVLGVREVERPVPGAGQVLVRVVAAGVNPLDGKIRAGRMREVFPTSLPAVPGQEFSGVVETVGEGVRGVAPGDEVLGWALGGSWAQYTLTESWVPKPASLDWAAAAALPVATETASRVLGLLALAPGETLLLHGAAGAVGTVAVQLAVAAGATVVGTASPANHAYLRELGAVPVAYGAGLVERVREVAPQGADAVFDAAGRGALPDSLELLGGSTGRIVTIADTDAATYGVTFSASRTGDPGPGLTEHARRAAEGTLVLPVAREFPLEDAAEAAAESDAGHVRGKLVLRIAQA
ncbi:NADP-dependent oxidoreductase [Streptomyces sp. NPDC007088]|uniref:NADP-dependent oxidoreductase n=1 Tax=Streptomyces sp. NPDC007088 TaxID=3364773 RepID=UPI003674028F